MACSSESFEHDADHCEADEGGDGCRVAFEITCEPTISADPCERPFNDPTLGHDNEAVPRRTPADQSLRLLLSGLGGNPAGPRLHWLGLIFLSTATFLFSCAGGILRGDSLWFIAFSTTLNITALQAGYLGSLVI